MAIHQTDDIRPPQRKTTSSTRQAHFATLYDYLSAIANRRGKFAEKHAGGRGIGDWRLGWDEETSNGCKATSPPVPNPQPPILPNRFVIPSSNDISDFGWHFFLPCYATGVWFLRGKMLSWRKREGYAQTRNYIVGIDAGSSLDRLEYMAVSSRLEDGQCDDAKRFGRRIGAGLAGLAGTGEADGAVGKAGVEGE